MPRALLTVKTSATLHGQLHCMDKNGPGTPEMATATTFPLLLFVCLFVILGSISFLSIT
jgi:hypothetical protein